MKNVKLIIGVLSILVFGAGLLFSIMNGIISHDIEIGIKMISGGGIVVFSFFIAGIIGIKKRKSKSGSIITGIFYVAAALVGGFSLGNHEELVIWGLDLIIWVVIAAILGIAFVADSLLRNKQINIQEK